MTWLKEALYVLSAIHAGIVGVPVQLKSLQHRLFSAFMPECGQKSRLPLQ